MAETIADTSALQYLHQLGLLGVLKTIVGNLVVPRAVADELEAGIRLGKNLPSPGSISWMTVVGPTSSRPLPRQEDLGRGESEVLLLALERPGAIALLDDRIARQVARLVGVPCVGVLGVLLQAKRSGHVPAVRPLLDRLESLGFRVSKTTKSEVLELAGE